MDSRNKKYKIIAAAFLILFTIVMIVLRIVKEKKIEENKAYVIGVVKEKVELETGFGYTCEYYYNNEKYKAEFSGLKGRYDTLFFFKISRNDPAVWLLIEGEHVPDCIKYSDVPKFGWDKLPACNNK